MPLFRHGSASQPIKCFLLFLSRLHDFVYRYRWKSTKSIIDISHEPLRILRKLFALPMYTRLYSYRLFVKSLYSYQHSTLLATALFNPYLMFLACFLSATIALDCPSRTLPVTSIPKCSFLSSAICFVVLAEDNRNSFSLVSISVHYLERSAAMIVVPASSVLGRDYLTKRAPVK